MKKIIGAIILSSLMLTSLSACESKNNTSAGNSSDLSVSSTTDNSEKEFLVGVPVEKDEPEETEAATEEKAVTVETEELVSYGATELFEYDVYTNHIEITKYIGKDIDIVNVPEEIDGYKVTAICRDAFKQNKKITTVILPETIAKIGHHAFWNCDNLSSINLPSSIEVIEYKAFLDCKSLGDITIPDGVTLLEEAIFSKCYGLRTVTVPDSVTEIEVDVFYACNDINVTYQGKMYNYDEWRSNFG